MAITVATQVTLATVTASIVRGTSFEVLAESGGTIQTEAIASPDGTDGDNENLLTTALNALVGTVVGTVTSTLQSLGAGSAAASLAVTGLIETTESAVIGSTLNTSGNQTSGRTRDDGVTTLANAGAVSSGAGVAVGVAVSLPIVVTGALLTLTTSTGAAEVDITAETGGTFTTEAISGAGAARSRRGPSVGLAGPLAVGLSLFTTLAHIVGTVQVAANTDVAIAATRIRAPSSRRAPQPAASGRRSPSTSRPA